MLIKDVLVLAAEELGRADLAAAAEEAYAQAAELSGEAATLLRCYHLAENEVALDHFPLKETETFLPADGAVLFTRFSRAPADVLDVRTAGGARVAFKVYPARLVLPAGTGEVRVTYSYIPARQGVTGESAFGGKISARLLAYGTASQFLLAGGRFEEAALFDEKFRAAVRAAGLARRKLWVRARRWA